MRNILLASIFWLLISVTGNAQYIEIIEGRAVYTTREVTTIEIVTDGEEVVKRVEVESSETAPRAKALKIVQAKTRVVPTFRFEDVNRRDVTDQWVKIDDYRYSSNREGKYWVIVEAISAELVNGDIKIFREVETKIVVIGNNPNPPDIVDPDDINVPDTDKDEFNGLASKVRQATSGLTRNREYAQMILDISTRMSTFDIIRMKDAAEEISDRSKPFLPEYANLSMLLKEDAKSRQMGWEQTIRYYEEIARGLR